MGDAGLPWAFLNTLVSARYGSIEQFLTAVHRLKAVGVVNCSGSSTTTLQLNRAQVEQLPGWTPGECRTWLRVDVESRVTATFSVRAYAVRRRWLASLVHGEAQFEVQHIHFPDVRLRDVRENGALHQALVAGRRQDDADEEEHALFERVCLVPLIVFPETISLLDVQRQGNDRAVLHFAVGEVRALVCVTLRRDDGGSITLEENQGRGVTVWLLANSDTYRDHPFYFLVDVLRHWIERDQLFLEGTIYMV